MNQNQRLAFNLRAQGFAGDARSLPQIRKALADPNLEIRVAATWALGYVRRPTVAETLISLLNDENIHIRVAAESGLVRQGRSVIPSLRGLIKSAPMGAESAQAAVRILHRLNADASSAESTEATPPRPPLSEANLLMAAHDLRGLATSVAMMLNSVTDDEALSAAARGRMHRAVSAVEMFQAILGSLLDERVSGPASLQTMAINPVISEAVRISRPVLDAHAANLSVELDNHEPILPIDQQGILRAVLNLVWNACKHTPEGTSVTVFSRRRRDSVCVGVNDDGPGMEPSAQRALSTAFVRGQGHAKHGWGLGLYIVSQVSQRHRGYVDIETSPGQGTCIQLWLPMLNRRRAAVG